MMYPFMTLDDETEIVHSELLSTGKVKVYIERPDEKDCFHHMTCYLPDYKVEEEPQTEYNDANYLGDSSKADAIDNDNRIKAESTWQIGRQKLLELTENGTLKFDPWNDQTELQVEYLRQKYRNIGLIIKSMDQGVESFKVSSVAVGNSGDSAAEVKKMQDALNTIAGCKESPSLRQRLM